MKNKIRLVEVRELFSSKV